MRPITLTLSAFGSYAGKTVLEMDKLGSQGLYPAKRKLIPFGAARSRNARKKMAMG